MFAFNSKQILMEKLPSLLLKIIPFYVNFIFEHRG
jgi:hypothetical protein